MGTAHAGGDDRREHFAVEDPEAIGSRWFEPLIIVVYTAMVVILVATLAAL